MSEITGKALENQGVIELAIGLGVFSNQGTDEAPDLAFNGQWFIDPIGQIQVALAHQPRRDHLLDGLDLVLSELQGASGELDDTEANLDESALSALIRVIDTVRYTVQTADASTENLSLLMGRPVAVVRAHAALEVQEGEVPSGLELRLGSLTQPDDGLLAWYADDQWSVVHPPHRAVAENAVQSGKYTLTSGQGVKKIRHRYVQVDGTVDLDRPHALTLLMDPMGGVHAASGVLPRKKITLPRDQCAKALARIAPTVRVGPVLVEPGAIRLPLPDADKLSWDWTHRTAPPDQDDNWTSLPVTPSDERARFSQNGVMIQEGWLRIN